MPRTQRTNSMQLYKCGCTSAEFISAATPIEGIFVNFHKKLTKGDPRSDLFANTFEAYQQTAVAMVAKERGRAGHPDRVNASSGSSQKDAHRPPSGHYDTR